MIGSLNNDGGDPEDNAKGKNYTLGQILQYLFSAHVGHKTFSS